MTEPLTDSPHRSPNRTKTRTTESTDASHQTLDGDDRDSTRESSPGTPRWVKAFGIVLVVLLLVVAALHLSGNAPTHMGISDGQHGIQVP